MQPEHHQTLAELPLRVRRTGAQSARLLWGCLLLLPACRAGRASPETSVKPGINEPYKNADVPMWLARFETESREIYRERHQIVEAAGLEPGMVVADIGAGTGLFVPLLAEAVGPAGRVLAVDIVPEFLEHIRRRVAGVHRNVHTVRCTERSVSLPPFSIDAAFLCDTYHHFEHPRESLRSLHSALKPGGLLVVVEFDRVPGVSRPWVLDHVRAGKETFLPEITAAGFTLLDEPIVPGLKENYVLRFRRAP